MLAKRGTVSVCGCFGYHLDGLISQLLVALHRLILFIACDSPARTLVITEWGVWGVCVCVCGGGGGELEGGGGAKALCVFRAMTF